VTCSQCGAEVRAGAAFCPRCGHAVTAAGPPPGGPPPPSRAVWFVLAGLVIGALATAGIAFVVARRSHHPISLPSGPGPTIVSPTTPSPSPSASPTETPTPSPTASPSPTQPPVPPGRKAAVSKVRSLGFTVVDTDHYGSGSGLHVLIGFCTGSADGACQHGFFFYGDRYLGLDLTATSAGINVTWRTATTVALRYQLYNPQDAMCCPSAGTAVVRYHWNGVRLVALDRIPPSDYGVPGSRR
jgi:LppP/LprE lipoprotein/zinc ribbon protein